MTSAYVFDAFNLQESPVGEILQQRQHEGLKEIMLPTEVAKLFGVNMKTVARWGDEGKLTCFRTPGGHRRYYREQVLDLYLKGSTNES